jgi:hypothetical protein
MIRMVRMMVRMRHRVMLGRMVMMLFGMQFVAMSLLSVMRFGLMVILMMRLVGLTVMVSGGVQMMSGFFVMVMLGHLSPPWGVRIAGGTIDDTRQSIPPADAPT